MCNPVQLFLSVICRKSLYMAPMGFIHVHVYTLYVRMYEYILSSMTHVYTYMYVRVYSELHDT